METTMTKGFSMGESLNAVHSDPCREAYTAFRQATTAMQNAKRDCVKCLYPKNKEHTPACRAAFKAYRDALHVLRLAKNACLRCQSIVGLIKEGRK